MYGKLRRYPRQTEWPTLATQANNVGDLMVWDGTQVKPATAITYSSSAAYTRRQMARVFAGVAMEMRTGKELAAKDMVLESACSFLMPMTAGTPVIGTLLGVEMVSTSTCDAQKLVIVTDPAEAIGYCIKNYAASTTEVECMLFSPYDAEGGLAARIHFLTIYGDLNASADIVTSFKFKKNVRLISIATIETVSGSSGTSVLTCRNGTHSLTNTHGVPTTGVGTFLRTALDNDASGYQIFKPDDTFSIGCDGGCTAGNATIIMEYMDLPALTG